MSNIILVVALAVVAFTGLVLRKAYTAITARELKRRAQKGDRRAQKLYRAVAYGTSLTVFLWLIIGAAATGLFFVVARDFSWPVAFVGIGIFLALGLAQSRTRLSKAGRRVALWLTPVIAWLLNYLHPIFRTIGNFFHNYASLSDHTQIYQKEDLVDLLQQQEKQVDNRIEKTELDMAAHALTFGDKLVRDVMTPFSQVKTVNVTDGLGPVLMDELHDSGHSRFPVYDGKKTNIVGILYLRELVGRSHGGVVKDIAHKQVTYVHEDQNLFQTMQAFLKTRHHLAVVVNEFEELVGVITIEDVLEQIIGRQIVDEFDQYEDLRAVATRMAAKVHQEQEHQS